MVLVSACLWGISCRYNGRASLSTELKQTLAPAGVLLVCPELAGGLPVPRPPASLRPGGKSGRDVWAGEAWLYDADGQDVTQAFKDGALNILKRALKLEIQQAYLKDRSPSCGFDPYGLNPRSGPSQGVLAALLWSHGISVTEVRA